MALRLGDGKPSALGKRLVHVICPGAQPMTNCHCDKMIYGFWLNQLGPAIKCRLADMKFTKETYKDMFKLADEVWMANGGSATPAVVAAVSAQAPSSSDPTPQVAAAQRGGGRGAPRGRGFRGGRGGRGGGRGSNSNSTSYNQNQNQPSSSSSSNNSSQQKPHQKGPRAHPDVPDNACSRHWKEGKAATYCSDPLVCDWVKFIAPRQK